MLYMNGCRYPPYIFSRPLSSQEIQVETWRSWSWTGSEAQTLGSGTGTLDAQGQQILIEIWGKCWEYDGICMYICI